MAESQTESGAEQRTVCHKTVISSPRSVTLHVSAVLAALRPPAHLADASRRRQLGVNLVLLGLAEHLEAVDILAEGPFELCSLGLAL